jgi:hypothetical protein
MTVGYVGSWSRHGAGRKHLTQHDTGLDGGQVAFPQFASSSNESHGATPEK